MRVRDDLPHVAAVGAGAPQFSLEPLILSMGQADSSQHGCFVLRGLSCQGLRVIQCHFCILLTKKVTGPAKTLGGHGPHLLIGGVVRVTLQKGMWDGRDACGCF